MFVVTENDLRALIAPTSPYVGGGTEWMRLGDEGELTTLGDIYRNQPGVRSVVDFIAGHCARMPIKMFKQEGGGTGDSNEGDREHLRRHPLQKLLNVPTGHKRQGRSGFWNDAWKDFLIYDRVCLVKIKDLTSNDPVALIRVPAMWFQAYGGSYFHPTHIRITGNRGLADIPIDDVIYIHGYDPADPRIGSSPMEALRSVLKEEAASTAWRNRFWDQGVQASMVVTRPVDAPDWDDGARDRFIESLRAASSRGRPLLLEEGMQSNPAAGFDPKSAQYIQSKEFTREEVLRVYNLPVGLFEQGSSANVAQYRAMLYAETLAPILGRFVDELETQLLTEWSNDPYDEGLYLEAAIEEKLRGNIMEQIIMFTQATGGPVMLRSEARAFMNLKSINDDKAKPDKLIVPSSAIIDGEPAGGTPPAPAGFGAGLPPTNNPSGNTPDKPANQNGPADPPSENDTATRADRGPQRDNQEARAGKAVLTKAKSDDRDRFVSAATTKLTAFAKRQAASVSSSGKFDQPRWDKELAADLVELRQKTVTHFGERAASKWESKFDPERVRGYNEEGAARQASFLNDQTKANFEAALKLGAFVAMSESILHRMEGAAVDVVDHMSAFGAHSAAVQTGRVVTKVWQTVSSNPRPTHSAQDGEEVELKDSFSNGLRYPHDPAGDVDETAGCTCQMEFNVSDEERPEDGEPA